MSMRETRQEADDVQLPRTDIILVYIDMCIYIYMVPPPPPCTHAFLLNLSFGKVWVLGMPLYPHLPHVRIAWVVGLGESACKS